MHLDILLEPDDLHKIVLSVSKRLANKKNSFANNEVALEQLLRKVVSGAEYLTVGFRGWWTFVEIGEIDVGGESLFNSPYNIVVRKFKLTKDNFCLSLSDAVKYGFVSLSLDGNDEREAINMLWSELISTLQDEWPAGFKILAIQ